MIDLVPVIYNNEKLFRFVHFSDEKRNQVNTEVNVENRLIPLRLEKDNCIKMNDSIYLKETSSTVYICINTFEIDDKELFSNIILIPNVSEFIQPILVIIKCQLLSYYVAKLNNCDIDKPRNLAKSVTVE